MADESYYDKLKSAVPLRADSEDAEEESGESPRPSNATGSFGMHKMTDMQTLMQYLNPDLGSDLNHIASGRTFPDIYRPLQRMLVKDRMFKTRGDMSVSLTDCIAKTNTVLSMSIDGEHIIDLLTAYGGAKREEVAKDGGLGFPR